MDMRQAFPGQHLKAADLGTSQPILTIAAVAMDKVGDDQKPVVKFYECQQDLVLNQTNSNTICEAYGHESQAWIGRQIQLYATKVQFGANMVDAIRVQIPTQQPQPQAAPPAVAPGAAFSPARQPAPGAPAPQFGQPAPGAPAPQFGQPAPGAPAPQFGQPAPGAPAPQFGQPANNWS